jgi:DNA replication initiation complex subunit (GINS family)
VTVDGKTILAAVPVTHLLFLEKQLVDLATLVGKLPTLDPAENWSHDPATDMYRSEPSETTRTKKVPRNHVKAEATKEHPAQVEMYYEDVTAGYWTATKFSGAISAADKNAMSERIRKLQDAVKLAREEANNIETKNQSTGGQILGYIFG